METSPDKEDSRSLFITIHQPFAARSLTKVRTRPLLSAKFVFDDYIRCMSARQRLQRRRTMLKQNKLHSIAQLLELPAMATPPSHYYTITPPDYINMGKNNQTSPARSVDSARTGRERSGAMSTITNPEQSLSLKARSSSLTQAQALAFLLEQSPPHGAVSETRINEKDISRIRTISVEEAEEAIDMEPRGNRNPSLKRIQESESISDGSSSDTFSREDSIENMSEIRFVKSKSHSAPATPRGGRRTPPVGGTEEDVFLVSGSSCLSDPAIYSYMEWESPSTAQSNESTKSRNSSKGTKKPNRKKKGHGRRRSTK